MPTSSAAWLKYLNNESGVLGTQGKTVAQTAAVIFTGNIWWIEALSVIVTIALIVGILILMGRLHWLESRVEKWKHVILEADANKARTKRSWKDIERHFFSGNDNDLKVAIIEADKTLDGALRDAGIIGANIGDRLKNAKLSQLPNLEYVWQAHKLRNQIAHDEHMELKRDTAERALTIYRQALESLGILEKKV